MDKDVVHHVVIISYIFNNHFNCDQWRAHLKSLSIKYYASQMLQKDFWNVVRHIVDYYDTEANCAISIFGNKIDV